jgi:hypothetical protein
VRFGKATEAPASMQGDDVKISSGNPNLVKWGPVVTQINVNFPKQ